jgi:hypothetical protein
MSRHPGDPQVLEAQPVKVSDGHIDLVDRDFDQTLEAFESAPDAERDYLLVDDVGGLGVVRATTTDRNVTCYDYCPNYWRSAVYDVLPRRSSSGFVSAVGPLPDTLGARFRQAKDGGRRARRYTDPHLPARAAAAKDERGWHAFLWFDLDGDDRIDVIQRMHECGCEHFAVETLVRDWDGVDWRTTERYTRLPLPVTPDRCDDEDAPSGFVTGRTVGR